MTPLRLPSTIGARLIIAPLTVDAPSAEAKMVQVVPGGVTPPDSTTHDVSASEVDSFVLAHGHVELVVNGFIGASFGQFRLPSD